MGRNLRLAVSYDIITNVFKGKREKGNKREWGEDNYECKVSQLIREDGVCRCPLWEWRKLHKHQGRSKG